MAAVPDERVSSSRPSETSRFQTAFAYPSAQGVVAVHPSFFRAVFFKDFGFNQLVMQVVEVVLHFAIGQFTVDQVAEVVVVIGRAVIGFQAVVRDGIVGCGRQDIMRRVEGEQFVAGLGNPAQFVVFEPGRPRPLVGTVGQVAGAVVAVAAFDGIDRCYCIFSCLGLRQLVECGNLPFQTAL